ncbi:hypothetical protein [Pseudoflavonifractor sp. MSJ-37]|uniref:hypothetical protein n=1 Tax=Pseudoflavonifractor sp. MSJ-37 TaxID=2841531 RepID=UPI00209E6679|nr:hypothetical protein [Pseudoflavonifractor sp. MSJ-37]
MLEILGQRLDPLFGDVGMLPQKREEIVVRLFLMYLTVDDDPAVGMDHIAAGIFLKGGNVQSLDDVLVKKSDRDGIVSKVPIFPVGYRAGKYQQLRSARQSGIHHHVFPLGNKFPRISLQAKVSRLPRRGHVIALGRKEIEFGRSGLLPDRLNILLNVLLIGTIPHRGRPHAQIGQVFFHDLVQHIVGLMEYLRQMGRAFVIDGPRDESKVPNAARDKDDKQDDSRRQSMDRFSPAEALTFDL